MRLRVTVEWAGDVVDDRVHDARELRVGAAPGDRITVPGDVRSSIRFLELGALVLAELPASLVAAIEWPDGVCEAVAHDTQLTLAGARSSGRLLLHDSPLPDHTTSVRFSVEPRLPPRRDVALVAWAAGALSVAMFLGAGLSFTQSAAPTLVGPHALGETEAALLRVTFEPSLNVLQPLDDRRSGRGGSGDGNGTSGRRDGVADPSRYSELLVEGFERYVEGSLEAAQASWSEASSLFPDRPEAWVNLAQVEKRRGALPAERALLMRALKAAPEHCEALVNLGLVETRMSSLAASHVVLGRARRACGDRTAFVLIDEAALAAAEGGRGATLAALESAAAALTIDTPDKRREALADLEHDPLFASVRGEPRFRAVLTQLRHSLNNPV
jgi:hypothetical protein